MCPDIPGNIEPRWRVSMVRDRGDCDMCCECLEASATLIGLFALPSMPRASISLRKVLQRSPKCHLALSRPRCCSRHGPIFLQRVLFPRSLLQYLHTSTLLARRPSQPICSSRLDLCRIPCIHQTFLQSIGVLLGASLLDPNFQAVLARHPDVMLGHVLLGRALESQRVEVDLIANPAEQCDCEEEEDKWKERGDCGHR